MQPSFSDQEITEFNSACFNGNAAVVQHYLNAGIDPEIKIPYRGLVQKTGLEMILTGPSDKASALHIALKCDQDEVAAILARAIRRKYAPDDYKAFTIINEELRKVRSYADRAARRAFWAVRDVLTQEIIPSLPGDWPQKAEGYLPSIGPERRSR